MNIIAKIKTYPQVFLGICLLVVAIIAVTCILLIGTGEANAKDGLQSTAGSIAQSFDATGPTGEAYTPKPGDAGEETGGLQIKQDGSDMLFSTDGGKTWSKEIPADSGMSVGVQEMPQDYR